MQSDIRSQIEELLAKNQLEEALEAFRVIPSLRQERIHLLRRLSSIKEERRKQTMSDERAAVELNKLTSAIQEYLNECDDLPPARSETSEKKDAFASHRGESRLEFDAYAEKESAKPIKQRWALLVGVNRYVDPTFPSLRFCVNDVLALEQQLKDLGYTVLTLHDGAKEQHLLPTRDNVEAELTRLCQAAGVDDLLFAHFACHGKLVSERPFLILQDTRRALLEKRGLALAEIETLMKASKARRLVLSLDACHVGVDLGRDVSDPEFVRNVYESAKVLLCWPPVPPSRWRRNGTTNSTACSAIFCWKL